MTRALYARLRWVCSAAFGPPVEPDVNSTTREVRRPRGGSRDRLARSSSASNRAAGHARRPSTSAHRRLDGASICSTSVAPGEVVDRRRDRAEPPARRGTARPTSRQFGACQATTSPRRTPASRRPPATRATTSSSARPSKRTPVDSSTTRSPATAPGRVGDAARRATARPTGHRARGTAARRGGGTSVELSRRSGVAPTCRSTRRRAAEDLRADEVALDLHRARADAQAADVAVRALDGVLAAE